MDVPWKASPDSGPKCRKCHSLLPPGSGQCKYGCIVRQYCSNALLRNICQIFQESHVLLCSLDDRCQLPGAHEKPSERCLGSVPLKSARMQDTQNDRTLGSAHLSDVPSLANESTTRLARTDCHCPRRGFGGTRGQRLARSRVCKGICRVLLGSESHRARHVSAHGASGSFSLFRTRSSKRHRRSMKRFAASSPDK